MTNSRINRAPVADPKARARFYAKVETAETDACWRWNGAKGSAGYGNFWLDGYVNAHTAAVLLDGRRVPAGSVVMHRCDNHACVNPRHLKVGNELANQRDSVRKGRRSRAHAKQKDWANGATRDSRGRFSNESRRTR